ncbi:MAG: DUF3592 domain-containing protein [Verrucomicrobiales bacterium]|nr:DUF3592 domain-containing protein [Verrucomicrobiales bacterium]MCP5559927.1 DUF3592 domain-containing protein [Verrucomicrobiaceae bacterium]
MADAYFSTYKVGLIVWMVLLAIGSIYFGMKAWLASAMCRWQKADGHVVASEMRRGSKITSDGSRLYDPVLNYTYEVNGQAYMSSVFQPGVPKQGDHALASFIGRHRPGSAVQVFYDPQCPTNSSLRLLSWKGPSFGSIACLALLILTVVRVVAG